MDANEIPKPPPIFSTPPPLPPPVLPGSPSPAPRKSRFWKAFAVAALIVVGLIAWVGVIAVHSLRHASTAGTWHRPARGARAAAALEEVTIEENESNNKIVVVDISGVISGEGSEEGMSMPELLRAELNRAASDDAVKAVVLRVDSPGGEVLASDELYRSMREFQNSSHKPIVTSMGSLAASGGYYLSAASRWIVANELTITGSIGVIFHTYNYRGLMDKVGVLPHVVKSGKLKDMLSPDKRPEDELPEERAILQDMITESFNRFKDVIREGRGWAAQQNRVEHIKGGHTLAEDWEDFADGRILSGQAALKLGLVDELGNFETAVKRARALADISDADLVGYELPRSVFHLFKLLGQANARAVDVRIAGVDLSSQLAPGRLYFISPVHVH